MLAELRPMLGHFGPRLSLSWAYVGLSWTHVEPVLGLCWPILGLCWPIPGLFGVFCAIYVDILLRCDIFRSGPSTRPKPRKSRGFFNIANMKSMAAEGAKTLKHSAFEHHARKALGRKWVGGRAEAPF